MRKMYSEKQVKALAGKRYKHTMTILLDALTSASITFYDNDPVVYDVTSLTAMLSTVGSMPVQSTKGGFAGIFYASSKPYFGIILSDGTPTAEEIESVTTSVTVEG